MKNKYISKNILNRLLKSTAKIKSVLFLFLGMAISANLNAQNSYIINTVGSTSFAPSSLTVTVGDTVTFINTGGSHNINGTQATFPNNPEGFGNGVVPGTWPFQWIFTMPGTYDYQCDPHIPAMSGIITVVNSDCPPSFSYTTVDATDIFTNDGEIIVTVDPLAVGPFDYYLFDISGAIIQGPFLSQTSNIFTFSNLASASYEVAVNNQNCPSLGFNILDSIVVYPSIGGSITYSGSMGYCGSSGTIITAFSNGCLSPIAPFSNNFELFDLATGLSIWNASTQLDSAVFPVLFAGDYVVQILNTENNCFSIDTFTVTTGFLSTSFVSTNVINATLGTASITAFSGIAPYSLCWQDPSTTPPCQIVPSWNNGGTLTGLASGTYTYTVESSDSPPCTVSDSIIIQNSCSAQLSNSFTICDSVIYLDAAMNMVDPGAYSFNYQLTDATNTTIELQTDTTASTTFTAPVTSSGMYYLTVTENTTGCVDTSSINVVINLITVTSTVINDTSFSPCTGSILVTPITGQFPYTFVWDTAGIIIPSFSVLPISSPFVTNPTLLCEDTYCLTITDANGCEYNDCYDVDFMPCDVTISIIAPIPCNGGLGVIQASIDTNNLPLGPFPFNGPRYIYQLFTTNPLVPYPGGNQQTNNQISAPFPPLLSGNYLVSVFDKSYDHYCFSDSLFLSHPDTIAIYTTVDSSSAPWIQDGVITIDSITGGTYPYNITWLDSVGNIFLPINYSTNGNDTLADSLLYSNQYNGGYTISVTDTNGCSQTVTVYVHPIITFPYQDSLQNWIDTTSIIQPTCFGSCDGKLWAHVYGVGTYAVPPFTFVWTDLLTGAILKVDSLGSTFYNPSHVATYTNRCEGVYGLSAYDYYGNPFTDQEFIVVDPDSLYVLLGEDMQSLYDSINFPCGEDTVLSSLVFGGTSLTNDTIFDISSDILSFNNAPTGFSDTLIPGRDYVLVVTGTYTDAFGVGNSFDAAYQFLPIPITPTIPMNWVMDGQTNHRPDPDVYDPINHTYYFPFVGNALPAIHNFYILSSGGFTGGLAFEVREIEFDTNIYTYSWGTNPPSFPIAVISTFDTALAYPGISGTDYILTVSDANGCTAKDTVNVSWDLYILNFDSIAITNVICNGDPTGAISITVDSSSGFTPYYYSDPDIIVSTSLTLASIPTTGLYIGDYVFHLQDNIGCLSLDTVVTITEPDSVYACGIDTALISVLVETFTMTFDAAYTHTTVSTQLGIEYKLVISGTYTDSWTSSTPVDIKDAAYQFNVSPELAINEWAWNGSSTRPIPDVYDATDHTYEYHFVGDGANQVFTYTDLTDTNYLNNGGNLNFELYKIVCNKNDTAFTCFGDSSGTATVYPEGGIPFDPDGVPNSGDEYYNVEWTDNSGVVWFGDETVYGLPVGNYTATITDSLDCAYERYLVVLQPATPVTIDSLAQSNLICKSDSSGEIYVVVSGGFGSKYIVLTLGLDTLYSVNGLSSFSDTIHIIGLPGGTYEFYIYDTIPDGLYGIYGCEKNVQIIITEPQDYLSSTVNTLSPGGVSCWGDSTATAVANVIGGQFPYTYTWDNGEINPIATSLWAGWQGITFTDSNGCTLRDSIDIIHLYPQIQAFNTFEDQNNLPQTYTAQVILNNSCFNSCDAIATLSTIGGVLPHTYWWDVQLGPTPANMPDTVSSLCAGGHDILVEDGVGCRHTISFMVTEPDELFAQAIMTQPVQCYGFNDGTAFGSATGGTPPYSFVWDSINGQAGQNAIALTPGIHVLYVTDFKGCTASDTVVITEPNLLEVEIIDSMTVYSYCAGTNSGQLCAVATGGTPSYNYVWNDGLGQTTSCAVNLIANQYTVIVMDDRNCIASVSFNLDSITNTMIVDSVDMTIVDEICFGAYNGSVTINSVGGAVAPFTYNWTPTVGTTNSISSLYAGSYAVVITDDNGCALTVNAEVGEPNELVYNTYTVIDETCFGACDGQIWVNVEGGTGNYYYDSSELGNFPIPNANQVQLINDSLILNLCTDLHSVYITDDNDCEGAVLWGGSWEEFVDSGVVVIAPIVVSDSASCFNSNDGGANIFWNPGPNPLFTYTWETTALPTTIIDTGISTSILYPGINAYVLVAHYADSASFGQVYSACDATSLPFSIFSPDSIISGVDVTDVSCWSDVDGSIDLTPTTYPSNVPNPPYSFSWDTTTSVNITLNSEDQSSLQPGTYTVTITDGDGCQITEDIIVGEPVPITSSFNITPVSCNGLSDGAATVLPVGGTGGYSYSWSPSGGNSATASGLSTGIYIVEITDGNGCKSSDTVSILEPASGTVIFAEANSQYTGPYDVRCYGESNASATAYGSAVSFSWSPSGGNSATASGLSAGTYTVTGTDLDGCTEQSIIVITEPDELLANGVQSGQLSAFGFDISCYGLSDGGIRVYPSGGVPLDGGYIYSWTGQINNQPLNLDSIKYLSVGTYSITIEDANNCIYNTSYVLTQPADTFVANVTTINYAGPVHGPATINFIDATTTSTNDPINHSWYWGDLDDPEIFSNSAGATFGHAFTEIGANKIYVDVQNANSGCIATVEFIIDVQGITDLNNVFTPNGDGQNDEFSFESYKMKIFEGQIFNRWGQVIVSWTGQNYSWNGISDVNDQSLPEGVYFFILQAEGEDGHYYEEKGSITLLR